MKNQIVSNIMKNDRLKLHLKKNRSKPLKDGEKHGKIKKWLHEAVAKLMTRVSVSLVTKECL